MNEAPTLREDSMTGGLLRAFMLLLLVSICLLACPVLGEQYTLKPMQDSGPPSGIRLLIDAPKGWKTFEGGRYAVSFVPVDTPAPPPDTSPYLRAVLEVTSHTTADLSFSTEQLLNPRHTVTFTSMKSGTAINAIRKVEVFDGGVYERLPIWLIRGRSYSYYLVILVRDSVQLEVGLRSDQRALTGEKRTNGTDELVLNELKKHKEALKKLVRSIQIVKSD